LPRRGNTGRARPKADVVNRPRAERRIISTPAALERLAAGFDAMTGLLALMLGPTQGAILNARSAGSVESLGDAGTIARRVVEIPGRGRNTGAMMARHLAWRMHEQFGDGAATAAVLAQALVREAIPRIAAGADPMLIRGGLERALPVATAALAAEAMPASGPAVLAGVATSITGDRELGAILGEIVDLLGPTALSFEEYPVPFLDREYVEGALWRAHPATREMIPEGRREVVLDRALIMLVDQPLSAFEDVRAALELAIHPGERRPLLVIPARIDGQALATISANLARGTLQAVATRLSAAGPALGDDLGDIAALTGGQVLADLLGRPPRRVQRDDLGSARRVVLTRESLTIVGGDGQQRIVAERRSSLQRRLEGPGLPADEQKRLRERIARLTGGSAILKIGAHSKTDLARKRAQAGKAFTVLTGMAADGAVPGGGAAFLAAMPVVRTLRESCVNTGHEDGVDLLLVALAAPLLQLARNEGRVHPPAVLAEIQRLGCGHGFDVFSGEYVDMRERGILDSLRVTQGALRMAVSSAISVITTGVVVIPPAAKRTLPGPT
jgi:chaperonin GroEL